MRFVHKKIPKSLAFLHILFASFGRKLVFGLPDRHLVRRLKLAADYIKPTNLRHCLHMQVRHRSRGPVDLAAMRKA
jgi:hypothetical protein